MRQSQQKNKYIYTPTALLSLIVFCWCNPLSQCSTNLVPWTCSTTWTEGMKQKPKGYLLFRMILLMVSKIRRGDHQLRLVVNIPLFSTGFIAPKGGFLAGSLVAINSYQGILSTLPDYSNPVMSFIPGDPKGNGDQKVFPSWPWLLLKDWRLLKPTQLYRKYFKKNTYK